jgi:hypothetical protein
VSDVEHDAGDYHNICMLLSHQLQAVRSLALAYSPFLRLGERIYIDGDQGQVGSARLFRIAGSPWPLGGKGLIIGTDEQGSPIDASSSLALITAAVTFVEMRGARLIRTDAPWNRGEE